MDSLVWICRGTSCRRSWRGCRRHGSAVAAADSSKDGDQSGVGATRPAGHRRGSAHSPEGRGAPQGRIGVEPQGRSGV